MKIASYNCCSINTHINEILQVFIHLKLDVICLQETLEPNELTINLLKKSNLFYHIQYSKECDGRGVGILARPELSPSVFPFPPLHINRILRAEITDPNSQDKFELLNVYAPTQSIVNNRNDRSPFFRDLAGLMKPITKGIQVLMGDFNMVENPILDYTYLSAQKKTENAKVQTIFSTAIMINDLVDTFRLKNRDKREYSYTNPPSKESSRIDRIYVQKNKANNIREAVIYPTFLTKHIDHKLIFINYKKSINKNNHTYTKLNPIFLEDENFVTLIENLIKDEQILKHNYRDSIKWWEHLKTTIIEKYVKYSKDDHFSDEKKLQQLYKDLTLSKAKDVKDEIWEQIEEINQKKVRRKFGATRGSFFKLNNFEKTFITTYSLDCLHDREECSINELEINNSQISDPTEIEKNIKEFYSDLYTSDNPQSTDIDDFLNMPLPQIPDDERDPLGELIDQEDATKALNGSNKGKTPGPDGIPLEFYQKFWHLIGKDLTEIFNNIFLANVAPGNFNHSVIKLVYKGKGPRKLLKNWRPISLLNSDYKILTKILANRMESILPNLINQAQSCAIKGRNMTDNLYNIQAILETCEENNEKALIVTLDQEKAFDKIEHKYLFKVLEKFNFPDDFIRWVQIIYSGAKARVNANGSLTEEFDITRSVRQGCPLSMILYILCIEPLARKIIADIRIRGVYIVNIRLQVKLSQYADDTCLILLDIRSLRCVYQHYESFSIASGSKINAGKTKILPIGDWRLNELTSIEDHVVVTIEILGVHFGGDVQKKNWGAIIGKCRSTIQKWSNIELSFRTKIYVINTFVLSKCMYAMTAIGIDDQYASNLQRLIMQYFWSGNERFSRQQCYLPFSEGGFGIPNIAKRAEAILVHRINKVKADMITTVPWAGYFIYSMAFSLRQIKPEIFSNLHRKRTTANAFGMKIILGIERIKSSPIYKVAIWQEKKSRPLYEALLDRTPPYIVRTYPTIRWREIYTLLWKDKERREREKEFLFQQLHGKLPTMVLGTNPSVRQLPGTINNCPFCEEFTETNEHIYGYCTRLTPFRDHVYRHIQRDGEMAAATAGISKDLILRFGIGLTETTNVIKKRLFSTVSAYKQTIWRYRNKFILGNIQVVHDDHIIRMFVRVLDDGGIIRY